LVDGVVTASAGNMAQGVAWAAREAGVRARVIAPVDAPRAKLDAVERLGGEIVPVTHEEWWQAMVERGRPGVEGLFVHPVEDEAVTVPLDDVADAMRVLASRVRVVAEGAGALALAAAKRRDDRCICIVSGGNVDAAVLARVLLGETP